MSKLDSQISVGFVSRAVLHDPPHSALHRAHHRRALPDICFDPRAQRKTTDTESDRAARKGTSPSQSRQQSLRIESVNERANPDNAGGAATAIRIATPANSRSNASSGHGDPVARSPIHEIAPLPRPTLRRHTSQSPWREPAATQAPMHGAAIHRSRVGRPTSAASPIQLPAVSVREPSQQPLARPSAWRAPQHPHRVNTPPQRP